MRCTYIVFAFSRDFNFLILRTHTKSVLRNRAKGQKKEMWRKQRGDSRALAIISLGRGWWISYRDYARSANAAAPAAAAATTCLAWSEVGAKQHDRQPTDESNIFFFADRTLPCPMIAGCKCRARFRPRNRDESATRSRESLRGAQQCPPRALRTASLHSTRTCFLAAKICDPESETAQSSLKKKL